MIQKYSVYADFLNYRSCRREAFVDLFLDELHLEKKKTILSIIECLHSSATIIDDMQDNEITRKESPCYYVRHGYSTASFMALKLWQKSITLISQNFNVLNFIPHLNNLISYQEADTGLKERAVQSPLNWYMDNISKKIGEELIIIYKLCIAYPNDIFLNFLLKIGQLIQCVDDKNDVLYNPHYKENQNNECCVITYSLPIACYLEMTFELQNDLEKVIGRYISFEEYDDILENIHIKEVSDLVETTIDTLRNEALALLSLLEPAHKIKAEKIIKFVEHDYWKNEFIKII